MEKTKLRLYFVEGFLLAVLLIALFMLDKVTNIALAIVLATVAVGLRFGFKKRNVLSLNQKQANTLIVVSAVIYIGLFYLIGFMNFGFVRTNLPLSWWTVRDFIIPTIVIVVATEYIRLVLMSQDDTVIVRRHEVHLGRFLTFLNTVLIDLILYTRIYDLNNFDDLLIVVGFVLFSSIACNLFYDYFAVRYGIKGLIIYRIVISVYAYILPIVPDVHVFLKAGARMLYPYFLYLILERTYSKEYYRISFRDKKRQNTLSFTVIVAILLWMGLISCQFKYGVLVIGSNSMEGVINVGDAIFMEQYADQEIERGSIVVFNINGLRIAHRVVEVKLENNELRYYTKGDRNEKNDEGYRTKEDLEAIVIGKIPYIGYPSLWLRDAFSGGGA